MASTLHVMGRVVCLALAMCRVLSGIFGCPSSSSESNHSAAGGGFTLQYRVILGLLESCRTLFSESSSPTPDGRSGTPRYALRPITNPHDRSITIVAELAPNGPWTVVQIADQACGTGPWLATVSSTVAFDTLSARPLRCFPARDGVRLGIGVGLRG